MEIKKIIITGNEKELEYISRILCGVINVTTLSKYQNSKKEGLMFLDTRVLAERVSSQLKSEDKPKTK